MLHWLSEDFVPGKGLGTLVFKFRSEFGEDFDCLKFWFLTYPLFLVSEVLMCLNPFWFS